MKIIFLRSKNALAYPVSRYQFEELILHWGNEGEGGSEHSVNGHFYPAEIQVKLGSGDPLCFLNYFRRKN
jgi:hypothetical protein